MSIERPRVAFFCATYLKPEMHHIHRQILAVRDLRPLVVAQKVENRATFPIDDLSVVPRSAFRFWARGVERYGGGGPWQISIGEAGRIADVLNDAGASVMHIFFGNVAVHLLPLFAQLRIPLVVSFHGADVTGAIAGERYASARREVFDRATVVACRSAALMEAVAELGCPRGKLRMVPTVLPEIPLIERNFPMDGSFRLVQASRLIAKKGLGTTIRAFAILAGDFPRMTLVIAGKGPLEPELRALAHELGVAGRVHFTGFLTQAALRDLFASSHVFVHPSETVDRDVEGVPNALLEAMASGLPVVSTRHGGIPEAVTDGVSGVLVDERDVEATARGIRSLLTDAAFYTGVATEGAAAVRLRHSADVVGRQLTELYTNLA